MNKTMMTMMCVLAAAGASESTITNLTVRSEKKEREILVTVVLPDAHDGDFVWVQFDCKSKGDKA